MTVLLPAPTPVLETAVPGPREPYAPRSIEVEGLVRRTHALLASRVPLTLLIDIGDPAGPHSVHRFVDEGGEADWLPSRG